jgi:DNA polymerase
MDKHEAMKRIDAEILDLNASPLYAYRVENKYLPVVGEGSLSADIFFVGEAPGRKEAETGRPFCGRSGKFLDEMLASIGLERQNVYITSVIKDRPEDNRDPTQEEIALYGPYLARQFDIVQPRVIVLLGRISMKYVFSLCGMAGELSTIGTMHGKAYEAELPHGRVVLLPLYHPAAALYNPKNRQVLLEDFRMLERFV